MGGGDSSNSNNTENAVKKCGLTEVVIFVLAILAGTACSICSKTMMELKSVGVTGEIEVFQKPIFQTFGMFVGMVFGIIMHWIVIYLKIPFPGYEHNHDTSTSNSTKGSLTASNGNHNHYGSIGSDGGGKEEEKESLIGGSDNNNGSSQSNSGIPTWMYFFLAIPSIFDLGATVLCMMGLQYIDVSIYQLLRGSGTLHASFLIVCECFLASSFYKNILSPIFFVIIINLHAKNIYFLNK